MRRYENKPREELIEELKELKQKYADLQAAYKKSSARNKQSDERNRLSLKEWQSTFDAIEDIVILLKPNHEIIKANKAALEALNKTPEEIVGKKCYHLIHNTNSPILGCPCEEACKEKRSIIKEYFQNGRFYELSAWPVFDEKNRVVWFTHVVKDITQRKKAEQALFHQSQMQELLRKIAFDFINVKLEDVEQVINNSLKDVGEFVKADRVYVFDYDWKNNVCSNTYEWCSPGVQPQIKELQGVPLDDIPYWVNTHKQGKIMLIPDVFALPENESLRQILEPQEIKSLITIPLMDGWECTGFLGFDSVREHHNYTETEEGLLAVLAQMFVNISYRQDAEKERQKLKHAIEQSPVSIFITGLEGNIEYVNPKTLETTGYTKEELIGKNPRIFNSGEKPKEDYQQLWSALLSGMEWTGEFHNKKKTGELYWEFASISPIQNEKQELINYVAIKEDITERKKFIEDLQIAKEKAEESDRLKSAFLANMSHEIRTPMNGILGFTELLLEPDLSSEQKEDFIKIVHQSGQRMLNTVNDIVEISKIEAGIVTVDLKEVDVQERLDEIMRFFNPETTKKGLKLTLENEVPKAVSVISTDQNKLDSIFTNLIKNAIKYTQAGEIRVGCTVHENMIGFYVKDTGIGIPAERQQAVFERFIKADILDKDARQGSGLGLAITKTYVEMLGGKIWVESEEGIGSTFYFTLPYIAEAQENATVKNSIPAIETVNMLNKLKILIAEDDETSGLLISIHVRKFGNEIITVQTGREAVEACRNNSDIDLILMDIQLPEMNGYEATRQIRQFNTEVIIIALTAFALAGDREKALETGCNDYISKPVKMAELVEMIQKYFKV